uniref:AlNc14C189G8393 protein n=1 Tax=Albugo laibachii Nc14 TaxID=890382 RepID=F0WPQ1_9STRA|nr:AlNc14C189G8393 [Albugo laibachii Nc14]CCA24361.1 AlNc14C235G9379 [Albugo laibachii Nc14]|eukprot:CCA24361.1 AlNc14C235G9379 [Albugo laibachii Nc14]
MIELFSAMHADDVMFTEFTDFEDVNNLFTSGSDYFFVSRSQKCRSHKLFKSMSVALSNRNYVASATLSQPMNTFLSNPKRWSWISKLP